LGAGFFYAKKEGDVWDLRKSIGGGSRIILVEERGRDGGDWSGGMAMVSGCFWRRYGGL